MAGALFGLGRIFPRCKVAICPPITRAQPQHSHCNDRPPLGFRMGLSRGIVHQQTQNNATKVVLLSYWLRRSAFAFDTPFFSKKGLSGMEECPPKLPRCTKHNPGKKPGRCGVEAGPSRAAARAQLLQIMAAEKMVGPRTGAGPVLTATGRPQNGTIRKMAQKQELNSQYTSPILNICHS